MKQLSGLDASFLYLETPEMPMHVGALHLYELPAGYKGRFVRDLRKHVATRLPLMGPLRRRLWWMPLNIANPVWVDAEPDLDQHIVEIKLPKGSGQAELEAQVGLLHPVLLDRSRPLWKFHVFEGLAPGPEGRKRVGLYAQVHHAAVDGQAAVALANALLDVSPTPRSIDAKGKSARTKKFELGTAEMIGGAVSHQLAQVAQMLRALPSAVGTLSGAAAQALKRTGASKSANLALAPRTRLNASVSNERAFAGVSLPLAELKALRRRHGATLNDLVLWLCSTALRRHFGRHGPLPRKSMMAGVPISLREAGDTTANNQASISLVSLGTNIADPARRLAHIKAATAAMKATMGSVKSLLPTDFPSIGVPWLMEAGAALYGRAKVADRLPPLANVAISNVPGPLMPLYMAGARILAIYPTSIVVHGVALNITVQSYNESLDFGLMACAKAMPEVRELADGLGVALDDLRALPEEEPAQPAKRGVVQRVRGAVGNGVGRVTRSVKAGTAIAATAGKLVARARPALRVNARASAPAKRVRGG
ncbi:MAG: wax ester/triacylglycerol synthase family O-acyltransferase [Betaproteobacteria bacterium]|nr:MAG: wax ester/triacylglycerol synthase family O-acyltransferase [Betaproteobacteria bacterium]